MASARRNSMSFELIPTKEEEKDEQWMKVRGALGYEATAIDTSDHGEEHILQVTFDPQVQSNRRRKSSFVTADLENPLFHQSASCCFIHGLLETVRGQNKDDMTPVMKKHEPAAASGVIPPFMSKSDLSDMAMGLRELSKTFASMKIAMKIKSVFLLTKTRDKAMVGYTKKLTEWLLSPARETQYTVYVDRKVLQRPDFDVSGLLASDDSYKGRLRYWTPELCATRPHIFDFVVTLGGDGTVLYTSWLFQKVVPPVFSFALGSLGFLTKFDWSDFESSLTDVLKNGVTVGLKLRFEGTIMRSIHKEKHFHGRSLKDEVVDGHQDTHMPEESFLVLNEIVVDRGPNPTMTTTELYANDILLTTIEADGVCIATPTGSTAYNLAAGGSLCHPDIPAMLVSPICAHTLSFRPLILPDSMVLRVGVPYDARISAWVSFDGRHRVELHRGDYIMITASRFPFPSVQSKQDNKDWFDSIRRTMNWGVRTRQKSLDDSEDKD